jgi:hypothetical protein
MLFFLLAFDRLLQARATRATSTNLTTAAA